MKTFQIASRNIRRDFRRTAITIITIVIGVFVIVLARGILKGFQNETKVQVIESRTGDIQIHKTGYRETLNILPLDLSVRFDDIMKLVSSVDGIKEASGRIFFSGQLTTLEESSMLFGKAIDVEKELVVCPRLKDNIVQGEFLTPEDKNKIVLTKDLFTKLHVELGDSLTLFAASKEGAINATELIVKGVFVSDMPDSSNKLGFIPLKTAQELLLMDGIVTEVVLKTEKNYNINEIVSEMKNRKSANELEINTWQEIEQGFIRAVANQDFLSIMVSVILFIIVFSTVMNTMLMVVLERTREIGTMIAIGYKNRHILFLFLLEGAMKGLIGGIIGSILGAAVVSILNTTGLVFSRPGTEQAAFVLRPEIDPGILVLSILFSLVAAVLASLYPANRGANMDPVEALRSV